jgi:hypothetical protein
MNREEMINKTMATLNLSRQDAEDYVGIFHCENLSSEERMCSTLAIGFKKTCSEINKAVQENEADIKRSWFLYSLARQKGCGIVYFVFNKKTGLVKIGKSTNVRKRIKQLENCATQLGMPKQVLSCPILIYAPYEKRYSELEKELHQRYADCRRIGEWFKIDLEVIKKDLSYDYLSPLYINDMLVYIDVPDILDLPLPHIRDCSATDLAAYTTTMISDEFDIMAKARAEIRYGISFEKVKDAYLDYHNQKLNDFILSELQSKVFKNTQLYLCKSCP